MDFVYVIQQRKRIYFTIQTKEQTVLLKEYYLYSDLTIEMVLFFSVGVNVCLADIVWDCAEDEVDGRHLSFLLVWEGVFWEGVEDVVTDE